MAKKSDENPLADLSWIEELSYEQLAKLKQGVEVQMEHVRQQEKEKLADEVKTKLSSLGLSLADLGLSGGSSAPRATRTLRAASTGEKKREVDTSRPCPICKYLTVPHHDGRHHRSQNPKAPYTQDELEAYQMAKA